MTATARPHPPRDTSADGWGNRLQAYALSHFPALWRGVMAVPPLRRLANDKIVDMAVRRAPARPMAFGAMTARADSAASCSAEYTSWEMLTDLGWYKRHLPQVPLRTDPPLDDVVALFRTDPGGGVPSEDSSVLFMSFAQWFTDGFLMTDAVDRRRTHSSHQIDLNPLYGLTRAETDAVRLRSEERGRRGRLKVEPINGEDFAPRYYDNAGNPRAEFAALRKPLRLDEWRSKAPPDRDEAVKATLFAFAGERANSTPYTAMLNTLFLREHNRLAGVIETAHPGWDDERVFQTARNVNIVLLIKIVIEEYINHISPYHFQLTADPAVCWRKYWNRQNWIPLEFNMLYRWHSLTPDRFAIAGQEIPATDLLFNHQPLVQHGLNAMMQAASNQRARQIGLFNTPDFLIPVEASTLQQSRDQRLASYNDYRQAFGYGRVRRFDQITGDPRRIEALQALYGDVDQVEFMVGLFAEDISPRSAVPPLIGRMVALDAFSQALTNPLMAECVFTPATFSEPGWRTIHETHRLQDILDRNTPPGTTPPRVTMTLPPAT